LTRVYGRKIGLFVPLDAKSHLVCAQVEVNSLLKIILKQYPWQHIGEHTCQQAWKHTWQHHLAAPLDSTLDSTLEFPFVQSISLYILAI